MGTPGDIKRFNDALCEIEDIKLQCPQCGMALVKAEIAHEGLPNSIATLTYQYCRGCDIYFMNWNELDEQE